MTDSEDVFITPELARRPARAPNYEAECRALVALARTMADAPETILQRLVETALELCDAHTAGISLLEDHDGKQLFRWHAIAGMYAKHLMGMAPRDFSPCGVVVDRAAPELLRYPGRRFPYLDQAEPRIAENLLIPFKISGQPVGTIWLIAHDEHRQFDAEDVRVMTNLGEFCAAALHAVHALDSRTTRLLTANAIIESQPGAERARDERVGRAGGGAGTRPASEEQFETLVQNVKDFAIFMLDADGHVTVWNEGAARLKGYTAEEIVGKHFSVFFTPEDRQIGKPDYEKGMAEAHGRYEGEGWRVRKDGSRFWGNEIISAIRDEKGRLAGFTKVARDLSQRRAMEDALRTSEARLRMLIENIRDHAVFTLDLTGNVTSWNAGAERVFGFAQHEIVGRQGSLLFTPEDRERGEPSAELATAAGAGHASDDRWQMRKGGERFWASGVTTAMRGGDGTLQGFAKICRDLTAQRQAEEQRERLLQEEKLARLEAERAMTLRDEFLAVVSHELRTPLTAILLWTKILRSSKGGKHDLAEVLQTIEQSAEAQRQLIEDLLDVSGMISGKLRLDVRETELVGVVRAAVDAVRPMAEAKGVAVEVSLDERAGRVLADPDRIQQVVWNLLNNAVKFTDRGGGVSVGLRRVDSNLEVKVADTGRGIDPAFLPHVFERFRQADATRTRTQGGLGLGLAISRQLVELHGGTITAESAGAGKGATFTVELPLADVRGQTGHPRRSAARTGAATEPFAPSPVLRGVRVLVVEDEANTRAAIRALLEECEAEVVTAESAALAVAAFRAGLSGRRFDALVSDIGMPVQDGYELMREIRDLERQRGEQHGVPAVALTAYTRGEDQSRAAAAGFQAHVSKPVEPAALVAAVIRLVDQPRISS